MISETGDDLVSATIEFLKWLGFNSAINADKLKEKGQVLEEDIQIEFDEGLIIIECKGVRQQTIVVKSPRLNTEDLMYLHCT